MSAKKIKQDPFDRFFKYSGIIVFLVPFLFYLSALRLGYVYFDDDVLILENQAKISNPANLGTIFTTDVFLGKTVPYYRPLLNVALMIGSGLGAANPIGYHLVSVLIHCLNCLGLLWLLSLLGFSKPKSLAGTFLFSLHPLISNAVCWVPALNDLLITLFGILSFATFIKVTQQRSLKYLILHLLFFAGAFFSKESAVALPFVFLLYLILKKQRLLDVQKTIMYLSWLGIIAIWFFMRKSSIGVLQGDEQGVGAILRNLPFLPEIISGFFLPFNLSVMPVFTLFRTFSGVVIILLIAAAIMLDKKKNTTLVILGLAWFLAFAIPNMFIRQFNTADSFDYLPHRACLPSVGLLVMVLAMLPEAWADLRKRQVQVILASLLAVFVLFSLVQEQKYKDGEAFWGSILKESPDRAWFHHFYGRYYFKQQDMAKFEEQLHEAVRLKEYGTFDYNLGMIELMEKKNYEGAFVYFTRAIEKGETKPEVMRNFINLCVESSAALAKSGAYDKASERAGIALKYDPANTDAMMNMALFSVNMGNSRKASALWHQVTLLNPSDKTAWKNLFLYYSATKTLSDSADYCAAQFVKCGGKADELRTR